MKRKLSIITGFAVGAAFFSSLTLAQPLVHHAYFNVAVGYSAVHYTNANLAGNFAATKITNNGLAPKVALGYDFTRYLGLEFGVIYFHKPEFWNVPTAFYDIKIKNNVIYLVGKLSLPLSAKWSAFAKGGIGYVARSGIITFNNFTVLPSGNYVMPVYGAGLSYAWHRNWDIDASYMGVPANSTHQLPSSHFVGIGISFRFL